MAGEGTQFETEVRRIARALWPSAEYGGAEIHGGQERDGVFVTEEVVHLIECTTLKKKDKAQKDIDKLLELSETFRKKYPDKAIKAWFVTRDDPTAEQREIAQATKGKVNALSFEHFRSKFIDAASYLEARQRYAFGSVRDPATGNISDPSEYVPLDLCVREQRNAVLSLETISGSLLSGQRYVLVGDYGAGKSMTMRELFFALTKRFRGGKCSQFPILLNLREHQGQTSPVEALERHGRALPLQYPSHLVKAWRAGYAIILLDGFDEMASSGWIPNAKKLKDARRRAVKLVRQFVEETPLGCGVMVAGREHYFDSPTEMRQSLGFDQSVPTISLSDFTDEQLKRFLVKNGFTGPVPEWLPSRPLLLGYLAARGLLMDALAIDINAAPSEAWDALLDKICRREAEIESGIDGEAVRRILEALATTARRSPDGMSSIDTADLYAAFIEACGYPPDEQSHVLLQRLPGLGVNVPGDPARKFIDQSLTSAARAGDIVRYIEDPYNRPLKDSATWQTQIGDVGAGIVAHRLDSLVDGKWMADALYDAKQKWDAVLLDICTCADMLDRTVKGLGVVINGLLIPELSTQDAPYITEFRDCVIGRLTISGEQDGSSTPKFVNCSIVIVEGRDAEAGLPSNFVECTVESYERSVLTTSGLLDLPLTLGTRVMLTILKKLYLQPGAGRKESALYRGLDPREQRAVPDVLELLQKEKLTTISGRPGERIVLPVRSEMKRVRALLGAPFTSSDPLIEKTRSLDVSS